MLQKYNISTKGDTETITLFENGKMYTANLSHPNWGKILHNVRHGEPAGHLFNLNTLSKEHFLAASDLFTYNEGNLLYRGKPLPQFLEKAIIELANTDGSFALIAKLFLVAEEKWDEGSFTSILHAVKDDPTCLTNDGRITLYAPTYPYCPQNLTPKSDFLIVNDDYSTEIGKAELGIGNVNGAMFTFTKFEKELTWTAPLSGEGVVSVDGKTLHAVSGVQLKTWGGHYFNVSTTSANNKTTETASFNLFAKKNTQRPSQTEMIYRPVLVNLAKSLISTPTTPDTGFVCKVSAFETLPYNANANPAL